MYKKIVVVGLMVLSMSLVAKNCDEYADVKKRLACEKSAHRIQQRGRDQAEGVHSGFKVPKNNGHNPQSLFGDTTKKKNAQKKPKLRLPHPHNRKPTPVLTRAKKTDHNKTSPADKSHQTQHAAGSSNSTVAQAQHADVDRSVLAQAGIANVQTALSVDSYREDVRLPVMADMLASDEGFGTPGSIGDDALYMQY